jgi:hypothetical protein
VDLSKSSDFVQFIPAAGWFLLPKIEVTSGRSVDSPIVL